MSSAVEIGGARIPKRQLMKAASALSDEEGLPGRAGALREIHALTVKYLDQRCRP